MSFAVLLLLSGFGVAILACALDGRSGTAGNPLLEDWSTPFETPPFDRIEDGHFEPAFEEGMARQRAEIDLIVERPEPATFANAVEALERSGQLLSRVGAVFANLNAADTNDARQRLARQIYPRLTGHRDDILMNAALFARIRSVHDRRDELDLSAEQRMLLEETHRDFVRGGADLPPASQKRLREINAELSRLSTDFGDNLLRETNAVALLLEDAEDLAGLPESVREAAAKTAVDRGHPGKWAFTLQRTSWTPFLQYSERRDLRERLYRGCSRLGAGGDNPSIAPRMARLRAERARLLGYESHAAFALERTMAGTPERVYELLDKLWEPALARARKERDELVALARKDGQEGIAPSDWWYYAEKLRAAKYAFDEETVKPYLVLERVREAAFDVAQRLFGITFEPRPDVPVFRDGMQAFEVRDADGSHLGLFYADYFTRESKRGGAWMHHFRSQRKERGRNIRPIIINVCNFSEPAPGSPALLTLDEARTLFHEFGHALHGLLSQGTYASLTGTSVPRDFVELPSQMMENWAFAREVLPTYAVHHASGDPIPADLVDKLQQAERFNQGFSTTEYLAASILDMDWHTRDGGALPDPERFEREVFERRELIPEIAPRYRTTSFAHIFAGGYSAGYYSYIWAEVLDADAFSLFEQRGLFDRELAASYREHVLARGGSEPPMQLYRRFRGADPTIEPLLQRRGLQG